MLASGSPRRLALLAQIGFRPEVRVADVDERARPDEGAEALAARLAAAKAEAVRGRLARELRTAPADSEGDRARRGADEAVAVLGADTVVAHAGRTLGKPADREAFLETFLALSGAWHRVVTAVAVLACDARAELRAISRVEVVTRVKLGELDRDAALAYWASGEPADKAGGYALQGLGARFVERVEGSPSNVVGLPLCEVARLLDAAGVDSSYPPGADG